MRPVRSPLAIIIAIAGAIAGGAYTLGDIGWLHGSTMPIVSRVQLAGAEMVIAGARFGSDTQASVCVGDAPALADCTRCDSLTATAWTDTRIVTRLPPVVSGWVYVTSSERETNSRGAPLPPIPVATWHWRPPVADRDHLPAVAYAVQMRLPDADWRDLATVGDTTHSIIISGGIQHQTRVAGLDSLGRQGQWSAASDWGVAQ